jgi:hypothetical protein
MTRGTPRNSAEDMQKRKRMDIYLDKRAVKTIRVSAADAIEEGDNETLKDDILEAFPEDQLEAIEQLLGGGDFSELLGDILDEWGGDDVDELFELLETQLAEQGIDLKYHTADEEDDEAEEETEEEESDEDFEGYDEYDEPGFDDDL